MELKKPDDKEEDDKDGDDDDEVKVNTLKILLFNILLPFCDLSIDVTKAVMLVFDYQNSPGQARGCIKERAK